jgi:hypothetical protein
MTDNPARLARKMLSEGDVVYRPKRRKKQPYTTRKGKTYLTRTKMNQKLTGMK